MEIDKTIGSWCDEEYVTILDDIAYKNLIDNCYTDYSESQGFISQVEMMYEQYHSNSFIVEYNHALVLLRKEKIKKILNRND